MNRPYVKQYDAEEELLNPIVDFYPSKKTSKDFPYGFPNRSERRKVLNKSTRDYSNKKGIQLIVTRLGAMTYTKYRKVLQKIGKKTIIHYKQS